MNLLAIDTSTEQMCLALIHQGKIFSHEEPGGAAASARLLPCIEALLHESKLSLNQVQLIAYGMGPGAFTGLRTACSTAQGLAMGLGCPVLPLDSLRIVAHDAITQWGGNEAAVAVVMDARMGEVYAGLYELHQGRWQCLIAPSLWKPALLQEHFLARSFNTPLIWAGTGLHLLQQDPSTPHPLASWTTYPQQVQRGRALAHCAVHTLQHEQPIDPSQALPLYARDKVAQTIEERRAQAQQGQQVQLL